MSLAGLVLAGGQGQRMGFQNKGLMPFHGRDLIDPVLDMLHLECPYIAISANAALERYKAKQCDVWQDEITLQNCGPLAGVYSSILHFPKNIDVIQVVPCDSPFLDSRVVRKLSAALHTLGCDAAYAVTASQSYPVIFQFKRKLMPQLYLYLCSENNKSIYQWLKQVHAQAVLFEQDQCFVNMNDLDTLNKFDLRE